jgi:[acyl-carrier-protein] S-malonyltransferase
MEPARKKLEEIFAEITFSDATVPVYRNVDGRAHTKADDIRDSVLRQTISPVQWVATLKNMESAYIDSFIELGAGKTLIGFVVKTLENVAMMSVVDLASLNTTLEVLGEK